MTVSCGIFDMTHLRLTIVRQKGESHLITPGKHSKLSFRIKRIKSFLQPTVKRKASTMNDDIQIVPENTLPEGKTWEDLVILVCKMPRHKREEFKRRAMKEGKYSAEKLTELALEYINR